MSNSESTIAVSDWSSVPKLICDRCEFLKFVSCCLYDDSCVKSTQYRGVHGCLISHEHHNKISISEYVDNNSNITLCFDLIRQSSSML